MLSKRFQLLLHVVILTLVLLSLLLVLLFFSGWIASNARTISILNQEVSVKWCVDTSHARSIRRRLPLLSTGLSNTFYDSPTHCSSRSFVHST